MTMVSKNHVVCARCHLPGLASAIDCGTRSSASRPSTRARVLARTASNRRASAFTSADVGASRAALSIRSERRETKLMPALNHARRSGETRASRIRAIGAWRLVPFSRMLYIARLIALNPDFPFGLRGPATGGSRLAPFGPHAKAPAACEPHASVHATCSAVLGTLRVHKERGRQKPFGCNRALIHGETHSSSLHRTTMRALRLTFSMAISRFRFRNFLPPTLQEHSIMNFDTLGLSPALLRALAEHGYTQPSPIQLAAIPPALAGRDLLAGAQTGTGKTAAFAL